MPKPRGDTDLLLLQLHQRLSTVPGVLSKIIKGKQINWKFLQEQDLKETGNTSSVKGAGWRARS